VAAKKHKRCFAVVVSAKARSYASRLCRPQAAWQCQHCQRDCSALKSVKGPTCVKGDLSRFSPSLRSGVRASPIVRTPRGSGQCGRPKNMKIASQMIAALQPFIYFGLGAPGPRAAGRDCEALKNVKSPDVSEAVSSRSTSEHSSGVRLRRLCVRHESRIRRFAPVAQGELTL